MKRKEYETPTMLVIELKGHQQLLAGSDLEKPDDQEVEPNDPMNP